MVPSLVSEVSALLKLIVSIIQKCEEKAQNSSTLQDLRKFLQDLNVSINQLEKKVVRIDNLNLSNSAVWALEAVKEDLNVAAGEAEEIWKRGYVYSVWNSRVIKSKIQALRDRVMTSFQTRLSLIWLDLAIESKHDQDAYQKAMLEVNKKLSDLVISTADSAMRLHLDIRNELRQALKIVTAAMESQPHKVEEAISRVQSVQPQTSDAVKFREDVLAALKFSPVEGEGDGRSSNSEPKWYEDRLTGETMCDPVKATDDLTYDRWTIIGKLNVDGKLGDGLIKNPYKPYDTSPFLIAEDDLVARSRLFREFPSQEKECQERRAAYRKRALKEVKLRHFGDAAMMLEHVLEWDPEDSECIVKLRDIQETIDALKSTEAFPIDASMITKPVKLDMAVEQQATSWAFRYNNNTAEVSSCGRDLIEVRHKGHRDLVAAVMADPTFCTASPRKFKDMLYFELTVYKGRRIGIGFCREDAFKSDEMPGWYGDSYGYHGDDGQLFTGQGCGSKFWKKFRTNHTVGAGLDLKANVVFFVLNGKRIAQQHHATSNLKSFCPLIALHPNEKVHLNFGQSCGFHWDGLS